MVKKVTEKCIEGLANGQVGLYMKSHHCLVDGTGGSGLGGIIADLNPDADSAPVDPAAAALTAVSDCVTVFDCASTEPGRGFAGDTARWLWGEFAA